MGIRNVYTIGEALFEIVFVDGEPRFSTPGGGMLNAAVSLGRMRVPVHLISEVGRDRIGAMLEAFLTESSVGTAFLIRHEHYPTALSVAFLDTEKQATYSFYKNFPEERLCGSFPVVHANDMVLFSSSFGVNPAARKNLLKFIEQARESGALILYDPNIRNCTSPDAGTLYRWHLENIRFADIIRGSDEDFEALFEGNTLESVFEALNLREDQVLICTRNKSGVKLLSHRLSLQLPVPAIEPESTIGAGDAFQAGIMYGLYQTGITRDQLPSLDDRAWQPILNQGIAFSQHVCMSRENFIASGLLAVSF